MDFCLSNNPCKPERYGIQNMKGNEESFSLGGWDFETNGGMDRKTLKKV